MTPPYQRYTLRLAPAVPAGAAGRPTRPDEGAAEDDWSGAAAYVRRPDPAALDYAHPEAVALLTLLQPAGWQEEEGGHTLVFWLEDERADDSQAVSVLAELAGLGHLSSVPEAPGWDEAWKEFHQPQAVGRVFLRPPWFSPREGLLDVVVDVGQAFGTGGHATTRECVAVLQQIDPGSLLDVGCGSGVVALTALRLGYEPVWGIDIDAVAVSEARENAARNGLGPAFSVGDATDPAVRLPDAEVVVANLALGPIVRLAPRFAPGARGGGGTSASLPRDLVLAGLLREQGEEAAAAYPAYEVVGRLEEEMWLMLHLRRRPCPP